MVAFWQSFQLLMQEVLASKQPAAMGEQKLRWAGFNDMRI